MTDDLTRSEIWQMLESHASVARDFKIADLVANEDRVDRMTMNLGDVVVDFSKHIATDETLDLLHRLALHQDVSGWFERMCAGDRVNVTEGRAAHHTALRDPNGPAIVQETLGRMRALADHIRASGCTDVIHIGIGGSDLGPRLVYDALENGTNPRVHFVANVDPEDLGKAMRGLNPQTTYISVASKTFTTQETSLNLEAAIAWLGGDWSRVVALTANTSAALAAGVPADQILPLWDWVGGRFSVWSAVGFPVLLGCGYDAFKDLLDGAHMADVHARTAEPERNIPLTMALLGVWYRNFMGCSSEAILPYAQRLNLLCNYLQQLEMESNGKSVTRDGMPVTYATCPVVFGQPGTNGQHAFYQMLHQGTEVIPSDFIGVLEPREAGVRHNALLANMLAQGRALMLGRTDPSDGHKTYPGNRPSTAILLPRLDARNLGVLLALYEHKTAFQGFIWGINPFDQFGVELGKILAKDLLAPGPQVEHNLEGDPSTHKLYLHTFG
ncbi:MAG TPA: glucose-6-phosphate isomerase [Alphaproteobacteria bacterium]